MFFEEQKTDDYPVRTSDRLTQVARFLFFVVLFVTVTGGYAVSQFKGLHDPVAMELAQISRNMAEGHGFVTRCIRPFDVWYLSERGLLPKNPETAIPVLWMAPAFPAVQSFVFRMMRPQFVAGGVGRSLMDAETRAVVPLGVLLTLASVLAIWLLGRTLFGARVALLGAGAYAVSDLTLSSSIAGLPTPLVTLLVTLSVLFAVLSVRRATGMEQGWVAALLTVLSALCAAAAVLADYAMIPLAIAVAVFLGVELQRHRWLHLPLYGLVLALVLVPWLMRNHAAGIGVLGAVPYGALSGSFLFPGDALERSVAPAFNVYRCSMAVRQGIADRLMQTVQGVGMVRGGVMFCFFMLAVFHRYEYSLHRVLKVVTLVLLVSLPVFSVAPGSFNGGWTALYPLVVLFGMSAFLDYLANEEYFDVSMKPLLTALLVVLCMLPAGLRVFSGAASAYPPYYAPIQHFAGSLPRAGEVLLTDIPWATSWYGDCTSMLLPVHPDDVAALPGGWLSVGGLYLTSASGHSTGGDPLWTLMLLNRQVPESVPLRDGISLPSGRLDQLLLSDAARWEPEETPAEP